MNRKIKIQLAIQGGGAKIVALMAVLEALEGLSDKFEVTRIVGTSAGAIAGTFFASNVGIAKIVKHWSEGGLNDLLSSLSIRHYRFVPKNVSLLMHLTKKKPVWESAKILTYLNEALKKDGSSIVTFDDLKKRRGIHVTTISTDLNSRDSKASRLEDRVVPALLDSAGLPYLLRKWHTGDSPVVVDGGIGNNLPATRLDIKHVEDLAVCVSFKPKVEPNTNPQDFRTFSLALLDAAIEVATSQSASIVPNTHFVETTLNTFDFNAALAALDNGEYQTIKGAASKWFNELYETTTTLVAQRATAYSVMNLHPWQSENSVAQAVMSGVWKAVKSQFGKQLIQFHKVELRATLNCLLPAPKSDVLRFTAEFEAGDEPLYCYWLGVSDGVASQLTKTPTLTIQNVETDEYVPHVRVPAVDPEDIHARYEVIFFTPALVKGTRYRMVQVEEGANLLRKLTENGQDELGIEPSREKGTTPESILVIDIPENIKRLAIKVKPGLNYESLQEIYPPQIAKKNIAPMSGFVTHALAAKNSIGLFALDITIAT